MVTAVNRDDDQIQETTCSFQKLFRSRMHMGFTEECKNNKIIPDLAKVSYKDMTKNEIDKFQKRNLMMRIMKS